MDNAKKAEISLDKDCKEIFNNLEGVQKSIADANKLTKQAFTAAETAKNEALFAANKDAGFSVWGGKKKEAIEALQKAVYSLSENNTSQIDAIKAVISVTTKLFNNQKDFSAICRQLFILGCMNQAATRTVVRQIELKLRNASKEKLSDLMREELKAVLIQLRNQIALEERFETHGKLLREHKELIDVLSNQQSTINEEINKLSKTVSETKNKFVKFETPAFNTPWRIVSLVALFCSLISLYILLSR